LPVSALLLQTPQIQNLISLKVVDFIFLKGIQFQGSNTMYHNNQLGCHKGHLYPAMNASGNPANAANRAASTYQYTNAVPQCGSFNTGLRRVWEGNIRAVQACIPNQGVLYLITGIAFVAIQSNQQPIQVPIVQ